MTPSPRQARWAAAALFLSNGLTIGAWAPQIPLLLPRHDIGEGVMGLLILGLGLGAVTAMTFSGWLIARFGTRKVLAAFSLALLPALPLIALAPNLWTLAPAMAFFGAMTGTMDVAMNASAVAVERRLGRAIMSASHGFWSLGGFTGGLVTSRLVTDFGPLSGAMTAAGIGLLLTLPALFFTLGEPPQPRATAASGKAKAGFWPQGSATWILGLMALFSMVPEGAVLDWGALYLAKEQAAPAEVAGLAFALFSATMAVMRFLGDGLRAKMGAVRVLRLSGMIAALGLAAAALAPSAPWALAGFTLAGLGIANMVPVLFSAAGNLPGLAPGAGIAAVTTLAYMGILAAPSAIGYVAEHAGFRGTYLAVAGLLLWVAYMAPRARDAETGPKGQSLQGEAALDPPL